MTGNAEALACQHKLCSCHWDLLQLILHIALPLLAAAALNSALEAPSCNRAAAVPVNPQRHTHLRRLP